jgi:hypothetical protein
MVKKNKERGKEMKYSINFLVRSVVRPNKEVNWSDPRVQEMVTFATEKCKLKDRFIVERFGQPRASRWALQLNFSNAGSIVKFLEHFPNLEQLNVWQSN